MGKESQKSALPTLFHFVRVRAAYQPHVRTFEASSFTLGKYCYKGFQFYLKSSPCTVCIEEDYTAIFFQLFILKSKSKTNISSRVYALVLILVLDSNMNS